MTRKRVKEFYENGESARRIEDQINAFLEEHYNIGDTFEVKYAMTTKPDGEIVTAALLIYEEEPSACD